MACTLSNDEEGMGDNSCLAYLDECYTLYSTVAENVHELYKF